jgi:hypothetical protein
MLAEAARGWKKPLLVLCTAAADKLAAVERTASPTKSFFIDLLTIS